MMVIHSAIIGVFLYLFLVFVLGVNQAVAENQSILVASLILAYMVVFGHGLPISVNKDLFF